MFDTKTFNEYVSKGDVICALVDKGQRSTRYKIGQEWELNLVEMQEAIDAIPITKIQKEELFTMCDDIKTEIIIEPDGEAFYGDKALLIYDDYIE